MKRSKTIFKDIDWKKIDLYEEGKLPLHEEALLFTSLLQSGIVWSLKGRRGHYGMRAMELINAGVIEEPVGLKTLGNHDYRNANTIDVSGD